MHIGLIKKVLAAAASVYPFIPARSLMQTVSQVQSEGLLSLCAANV